ncbi:E3 ubiquitin-protein ligase TRIM62 isoform X1 [Latimeria chalumnae]|uniref:E3 ubiquitin-protein ligase TRIM62 isoform X1 n=1 Tax=Latimeria chalumnae TaxID=7897 RepID=UPI0006D8DADE|nr:PREDICTED: E3 ubiquitin-protein ligase TRIM62-like [Latimeria chalumnae]|eukprot:XP_006004658.2 PREDICTED: E3 ubiquitin-protein ligase TRIM62-like [Latimeria chalumnae]
MASGPDSSKLSKELFCPVCLDVFVDPVETDCGHYFCRACIGRYWKPRDHLECPECWAVCSNVLRKNRFVSDLVDSYRQTNARAVGQSDGALCMTHGRKLDRFCLTDKKLICLDCRDTRKHQQHRVLILQEAAEEFKAELRISLSKITDGRAKQVQDKQRYEILLAKLQSNTRDAERKIKEFYRKLRTILEEEEVSLLEKLRKEEADGTKKLKKKLQNLPEEIYSMERRIIEIEKDLAQQDHFTFLQKIAAAQQSVKLEPFKEEILSVELETHKYLGPQLFYTWKKMLKEIDTVPAALTFDRETAAPNVQVTGDNRRAVKRHFSGKVPDSPQRFGQDAVLAAEGFTAGAHYWEAEVEVLHDMQQIKDTLLGVACTSVQRKGDSPCNPENGFWVCPVGKLVELWQRRRTAEVSEKRKFTVGVYLNYEEGTVSFYDADAMSHVHTISGEFTEKVYPYFKLVHAMRFHCFNFYVSVT